MFTMLTENTRRVTSAVAAVAVVAFAGLTLDQGHQGALPEGTVEVGEMTPVNLMQLAMVTLPEVVVTGERIEAGARRARTAQPALLPWPRGCGRQGGAGRPEQPGQGQRVQGQCPAKVVL